MKAKKALLFVATLMIFTILNPASRLSAAPLYTLSFTLNFPLMMNNNVGPPPSSTSYYLKEVNQNYSLGCSKGAEDTNSKETRDSIVILDYGGISQWGTNPIVYGVNGWNALRSVDEIATATENFASGYFNCNNNSSKLQIIIGTNDSTDQSYINANHGEAWANMVQSVNNWLTNQQYSSQITAAGGNDIELGWKAPSIIEPWIVGFSLNSNGTVKHYNYGNAVDCKVSSDLCFSPWTKHDVWYVSFGASTYYWGIGSDLMFPFPEIYNISPGNIVYDNAQQWYAVGQYSRYHESSQMTFPAVLSQFQACQQQNPPCDPSIYTNPDRSWLELMRRLAADVDTRQLNIQWLSDLIWYPSSN